MKERSPAPSSAHIARNLKRDEPQATFFYGHGKTLLHSALAEENERLGVLSSTHAIPRPLTSDIDQPAWPQTDELRRNADPIASAGKLQNALVRLLAQKSHRIRVERSPEPVKQSPGGGDSSISGRSNATIRYRSAPLTIEERRRNEDTNEKPDKSPYQEKSGWPSKRSSTLMLS